MLKSITASYGTIMDFHSPEHADIEHDEEEASSVYWDTSAFRFIRATPDTAVMQQRASDHDDTANLVHYLMDGMSSTAGEPIACNTRSQDRRRPLLTLTNSNSSRHHDNRNGGFLQGSSVKNRNRGGSVDMNTPLRRSKRIRRSSDQKQSLQALREIRELLEQRFVPTIKRATYITALWKNYCVHRSEYVFMHSVIF